MYFLIGMRGENDCEGHLVKKDSIKMLRWADNATGDSALVVLPSRSLKSVLRGTALTDQLFFSAAALCRAPGYYQSLSPRGNHKSRDEETCDIACDRLLYPLPYIQFSLAHRSLFHLPSLLDIVSMRDLLDRSCVYWSTVKR